MTFTTLPLVWQDPLALAPLLNDYQHAALLYSGAGDQQQSNYSYLCLGAKRILKGNDLSALKPAIHTNAAWYEHFLVGWLGYGLKNQLETLPTDSPAPITTDDYYCMEPETIYRFNHQQKTVECFGYHQLEAYWHGLPPSTPTAIEVAQLQSNMSRSDYLNHVETILEAIRAGTCYQANLTRKFFGWLDRTPSTGDLFSALCHTNPANYSALIRAKDISVISSSPELFLHIDQAQTITTRPIKGTMGRSAAPKEDARRKQQLANSEKDRAENLMIVDLMRNDLSRVCQPGSVKVESLFDITTHTHIHHMSSLISGQLSAASHPLDASLACFPPGSMTGAPKIKAMEICSQLERQQRGIYSGALGWFGGDGSAHLSVVIRTLILKERQFEFQVGGGIVADSIANKEFEETMDKAKGICNLLGISAEQIRAL